MERASTLTAAASVDAVSSTQLDLIVALRNINTVLLSDNEISFLVLGDLSE